MILHEMILRDLYVQWWSTQVGRPVTWEEVQPLVAAFVDSRGGLAWWAAARASREAWKAHLTELTKAVLAELTHV